MEYKKETHGCLIDWETGKPLEVYYLERDEKKTSALAKSGYEAGVRMRHVLAGTKPPKRSFIKILFNYFKK